MNAKSREFWKYFKRHYALYIMLAVPVIYFIVFKYIPMGGIVIAFEDYNLKKGILGSEWIGFDNFRSLFHMTKFWRAVRNTIMLNGMDLLLGFPAPIILALLLNEIRDGKGKKLIQTVIYLPHFISWVVVGGLVLLVFATEGGLINTLLKSIGLKGIPFLGKELPWMFTYQLTSIWKNAGWSAIIYIAAIAGVDQEQYESAKIDGCSRFKMMYLITLPNIIPTVVIMLILKIGNIVTIGFDQPFMLGNSMVRSVSEVLSTYSYSLGFSGGRFDVATALGAFQSVINFAFVLTANKVCDKLSGQALW